MYLWTFQCLCWGQYGFVRSLTTSGSISLAKSCSAAMVLSAWNTCLGHVNAHPGCAIPAGFQRMGGRQLLGVVEFTTNATQSTVKAGT